MRRLLLWRILLGLLRFGLLGLLRHGLGLLLRGLLGLLLHGLLGLLRGRFLGLLQRRLALLRRGLLGLRLGLDDGFGRRSQADVDGHRDRVGVDQCPRCRVRRDHRSCRQVARHLHDLGEEERVVQRGRRRVDVLARDVGDGDEIGEVRPGAYGDAHAASALKLRPRCGLLVDDLARGYLLARGLRLPAEL